MDKRIDYLDGLRAISILMVLFWHGAHTFYDQMPKWLGYFLGSSHLGVMIFFNISGFLITTLLLKEIVKNGKISIVGFYKRRILRIFPVFYTYILCIGILAYYNIVKIDSGNFAFVSAHLWNYKEALSNIPEGADIWYIGHFWTLALEEQFYLFWPIILYFSDAKKVMRLLPYILLLFPFIRFGSYFLFPALRGQIGMMLHTMGDSILWGSYAALLVHFKGEYIFGKLAQMKKYGILLLAFAFLLFISDFLSSVFHGGYSVTIGYTLESISISIVILYLILFKPVHFGFLNNRLFVYIGTLSYSLYIWQQLFLAGTENSLHFSFPLNFILCFAAAFISYNTVERLGLYIKSRLKRQTS